jgi:hypothetical protein
MTIDEAIERTINIFPFKEYINPEKREKGTHQDIARTVLHHLKTGGRILDFGSGPCDKTAIL